jgi:hypothetical protein
MHEIETWITEAARANNLPLRRISPAEGSALVRNAQAIFVEDDPRRWWLSLKLPYTQTTCGEAALTDLLPSTDGTCLLLPETDTADLPVYEVDARHVEALIKDCPYFEYYVLAKDLSWLVAESDHNVFFVCEQPSTTLESRGS